MSKFNTTLHLKLVKFSIYRKLIRATFYVASKVLHPVDTVKKIYKAVKNFILDTRDLIVMELNWASEQTLAYEDATIPIPKMKEEHRQLRDRLIFEKMERRDHFNDGGDGIFGFGSDDLIDLPKEYIEEIKEQLRNRSIAANEFKIPGQRPPKPPEETKE
jgi:hypothetical protein